MQPSWIGRAALIGAVALGVAARGEASAQTMSNDASPEATSATEVASPAATVGQPFRNPPEIVSKNGVLSATLTVEPAELPVAGEDVTFPALYNGLYTPPLLRTKPGDQVRLLLNNFAQQPTNVHYHGFNVTPRLRGDNIFVSVNSGTRSSTISRFRRIIGKVCTGIIPIAILC